MGKNKYTKILNHLKSEEIDHKISLLNERMTSSGFYFTTGLDSGVPAVPGIPAVPPTYENVTGGISNLNDFVWGNQGDGSNPNAPVNIPSNLYTTYNGEQVAAIRQIDGTYPNGVTPLAFGVRDGWLSTYYVGYLSSGGFTSVASVGVYANASTDLGRAYQQAYYDLGKPGTIFEHYTQKVIYLWGSLDCLFGDCKGASQYYPSNLTAFTTPKADYALYSYTLYIPTDASGVALPNRFMTDPGSLEVPEVPAIPPKPIVLDRYNLGDPNYYPGPIQIAFDFLKNIGKSLSEFGQNAEQLINKVGDNIKSLEGQIFNNDYVKSITNITNGIEDGINLLSNVKNVIESAKLGPQDSSGRYTLSPGSLGTIDNPLQNRVSSSTQEYLLTGYQPSIDGPIDQYLQRQTSRGIEQGGNVGAKGTHNNITGKPYIDNQGNIRIPDTYGFGPSQDVYNKPIVKQTVDIIGGIAGALGGENVKQEVSNNIQTFFDQSVFGLLPGTPGENAPIVHFETIIPAKDAQKLAPDYLNQPVKEETLFERFKKQNQIIEDREYSNEFDSLIEQIKSLPKPIKKYLLLEFETSIKLSTLSPQERRFKEQEIKNNLLVKTSELYVDTHFPENIKLFKRLQKSIKKNIELTDPKTFKSPAGVLSYKQLVSKDFVNENDEIEKKKYAKRKNLVKKLFKKPERKKSIIDEKLNQLNKELKKTGMNP